MSTKEILRVKGDIKATYAKLSKIYAILEERFEKKLREKGLELLDVQKGEVVLEIGFGTGCSLVEIAKSVGETGKVYGIDLTPEMVKLSKERLEKEGLEEKAELQEGNARKMSYRDNMFDAVYMASTLELFDTPDIAKVLREIKRVLKPTGRLGVVSIAKEGHEDSKILKFYEWLHQKIPKYASCRPIYVEDSIKDTGYKIIKKEEMMIAKLFPMKIVMAKLFWKEK